MLRKFHSLLVLLCLAAQPGFAEERWFVGAALGGETHNTSLSVDEGSLDLLFEPEDNGISYAVEVGYAFSDHLFATAEYSHFDADTTKLDNFLLTLNYQWTLSDRWSGFVGAVGGGSTLEWQEAPIDAILSDPESDAAVWGAQLGLGYSLGEHWRIDARYQYLSIEHDTKLQQPSGRGEYRHDKFNHFTLGIRRYF
jgi:opacity protein-like surface antigen